jgi:N-acetylglucosamine-6-sulfatase
MQGSSLARLLRGESYVLRDSFLYEYDTEAPFPVVPDIRAVRTQTGKYVTYPAAPSDDELYDLTTDPGEVVNLAQRPEWATARAALRQQLDRLLTRPALSSGRGASARVCASSPDCLRLFTFSFTSA